jgi:hypothetical protein
MLPVLARRPPPLLLLLTLGLGEGIIVVVDVDIVLGVKRRAVQMNKE